MKNINPAIQELLKAGAPGAWTSEGVPLPEPIFNALLEVERIQIELQEQEQRIAAVGRWRHETTGFFNYLKDRFLDGQNLFSVVLLRRVLLFTSFVGIWCTPSFCDSVFLRWQMLKAQPDAVTIGWNVRLIAIGIYLAAANAHIMTDFFTNKKSFFRISYFISATVNIGYAVCYLVACFVKF